MEKNPEHKAKHASSAPPRTALRTRLIAVLIAAAALAALCGCQPQTLPDQADRQTDQPGQQEVETKQQPEETEQQPTETEQQPAETQQPEETEQQPEETEQQPAETQQQPEQQETPPGQAQATPEPLPQYTQAPSGGAAADYTALYPNFYAPEWTGETVTGGRVCCLTFDDGPSANTDRVLETLDRYGAKATFFVVGSSASSAENQERMRQIVAAGHAIAMHSWSHDYYSVYASVEGFLAEFSQLFDLIHEATGVYPSVYRFPGGSINGYNTAVRREIIAEMARRGFVYFDWNVSAGDSTPTPGEVSAITANCLTGIGRDLVVMLAHDSFARTTTADALPAVIQAYQEAGYTFSPLHPGVKQVIMG